MAHAGPFFLHDLWENHQMILLNLIELLDVVGKSQKNIRFLLISLHPFKNVAIRLMYSNSLKKRLHANPFCTILIDWLGSLNPLYYMFPIKKQGFDPNSHKIPDRAHANARKSH